MKKIMIGSKNPAKILAAEAALQEFEAEIFSVDASSGVSEQPFSDEETIQGAMNRAKDAMQKGNGEIGIGLEGGVVETEYGLYVCNWGALYEEGQPPIIAGGARIPLPEEIAGKLRAGMELGPVMDEYAQKENVRKKDGAVGIFTSGRITRIDMFTHICSMLLGQYEYRSRVER
ncbi:DUF84 family protein [Cytobacillus gottheilii]|uniref:DUF84 family protein n=1 Tax=Cytobacillus gottheilii TaxID=859144 RepID=UPI0009BAFBF1|nr:DUF84 family protein [Cytobacillus gottheilii]